MTGIRSAPVVFFRQVDLKGCHYETAPATAMSPILAPHLAADPNSKVGAERFDELKSWLDARAQVCAVEGC